MKKAWTARELQYLKEHARTQPAKQIAEHLGRSKASVEEKRWSLGLKSSRPVWSQEEKDILAEAWGHMTVAGICKKLGRSKNAVMVMVNRLGLPPYLESGEYVTMHQLILALGYSGSSDSYKIKSWIENRDFPVHNKRRGKAVIRVVQRLVLYTVCREQLRKPVW